MYWYKDSQVISYCHRDGSQRGISRCIDSVMYWYTDSQIISYCHRDGKSEREVRGVLGV